MGTLNPVVLVVCSCQGFCAKEQRHRWVGCGLWSCSIRLLAAANLYWGLGAYLRGTHQCTRSRSEKQLWDVSVQCHHIPPYHRPDLLLCPHFLWRPHTWSFPLFCSAPHSFLAQSVCLNFWFLGDESEGLSSARCWLGGGRGARSPGSVGEYMVTGEFTMQWGPRLIQPMLLCKCFASWIWIRFKRLYFKIISNIQKSCRNTKNSYIA